MDVFNYLNYRGYLSDFYEDQKARKTGFTYANFAKKAGLKSPNYYKLVKDGEKNLTSENVLRFSLGLEFDECQANYFETLVNYNQAKSSLEKEFYLHRIKKLKVEYIAEKERFLTNKECEKISHWLYHTLYVLNTTEAWSDDKEELKRLLVHRVSVEEIEEAVSTLKELGLIEQDSNVSRVKVQTEKQSTAVRNQYKSILSRAESIFDGENIEKAVLGSYTVSVSEENFDELQKRVQNFMRELVDWAYQSEKRGAIYNLSFLGFPVTEKINLKSRS